MRGKKVDVGKQSPAQQDALEIRPPTDSVLNWARAHPSLHTIYWESRDSGFSDAHLPHLVSSK